MSKLLGCVRCDTHGDSEGRLKRHARSERVARQTTRTRVAPYRSRVGSHLFSVSESVVGEPGLAEVELVGIVGWIGKPKTVTR
jgi:hypothetical protein